jgi:hypothetical protein
MAKQKPQEIGMFGPASGDTMHEAVEISAVRIRAERIYMRDFMSRMADKALERGDNNLYNTCIRIRSTYEELLKS